MKQRYTIDESLVEPRWTELGFARLLSDGALVPDTTLQDIADASRCEHGNIYSHPTASLHSIRENTGASLWTVDVCAGSPELADLLAALEGDNDE